MTEVVQRAVEYVQACAHPYLDVGASGSHAAEEYSRSGQTH